MIKENKTEADWEKLYFWFMQNKDRNPKLYESMKNSLGDEWDIMMEKVTKSLKL